MMPSVRSTGPGPRGAVAAGALRVAMVLPGLGRVERGAEAAFVEVARHLARSPGVRVELFGSGERGLEGLDAHAVPCRPRERFERWPRLPAFRTECYYEEFSYTWNLARSGRYRPEDFDVVVSCSYPWINWYLRWAGRGRGPVHVYVTQNGDWPCQARSREFRHFRCDGLVCTNPVYFERNRGRYPAVLIPNGVDPDVFRPRAPGEPAGAVPELDGFDPGGRRVVLMASAMIASKGVADGVRAAARVEDAFLLVAGDGPERDAVAALARELLPDRHRLLGPLPRDRMPALYRRADAFLHTSRVEPSALVYLEAAATGLPMVVHDRDVTRWTLGDAALYADTADPDAVADALRRALAPDAAATLGAAARRRVLDGWSWEALAGRYRDFFHELLAARRVGP